MTPAAIPWLLLRATSTTGTGVFTNVTYVQRLNTTGGVAPGAVTPRRRAPTRASRTRPTTTSTRAAVRQPGSRHRPAFRPRLCRRTQAAPIGSPFAGTFTAIDRNTNKIAWQQQMPHRMGGGGGSTVTAGGLLLRGEPDGNFVALNAKTGDNLCQFQTGFGADAPPVVYEVDGQQYITIVTGGNPIQGSATGDAVWTFALNGNVQPLWPPPPPLDGGRCPWARSPKGRTQCGSARTTSSSATSLPARE